MLDPKALEAGIDAALSRYNDDTAPRRCGSWREHLREMTSDAIRAYLSASIPAELDAVDMDMIQRGDRLGPELGARVASALLSLSAELETVKKERDKLVCRVQDLKIEAKHAAEAKLADGEAVKPLLAYIRAIDAEPGARLNFPDDRWVVHGNAVGGFTFGDLRALASGGKQ